MTGWKAWIGETQNNEQGDFCDTDSKHEYQVGNLTDAVEAETEAVEAGGKAIWVDAAVDESLPYDIEGGQTFVIHRTQEDGQGNNYSRRRE
jgi:hypothetical protein